MIKYNKHIFDNGLRLIHHYDSATKMVALNLLYNVGSKDEQPDKTGLAHLLEHLMFSGSKNATNFDDELQMAGGVSNAWTNMDMTNYYETLPSHNIETALWLESDRLISLSLSDESIRIQKDVVIEEFKQRYLNEPYGDLTHLIQKLAYKKHPYRWPTIGVNTNHIQEVENEEIKKFKHQFYSVNNLIICISGNITFDKAVKLTGKWFEDIKPSNFPTRKLTKEPIQNAPRELTVIRDVPQKMIYRAYHMPGRNSIDYPAYDLLSDILANGKSSRFYNNIMAKNSIFTELDAAIQGTIEPGLFLIRGRLNDDTSFDQANVTIDNEIKKLISEGITQYELDKCINKFHASMLFDNIGYQEKATKLCEYELLGSAGLLNQEVERYRQTTTKHLQDIATKLFSPNNCSTIYYSNS